MSEVEARPIGPEDIERNGHDGEYVRAPKSPGWVRLADGWFAVQRPTDANRQIWGPVSERASPLKQAQTDKWTAGMAAASARGQLVRLRLLAERHNVPFA